MELGESFGVGAVEAAALIDGDPFAGVYASLMLPTEGVWAFGIRGNGEYGLETAQDPSREEWFFAGSIAVERSLSDQVGLPPGLTAAVGARAGVMVERETIATLTRTEPYPLAGIYGVMSWSVFRGLGLESSIHLDAGVGVRVGAAFGINVTLPRGGGT